MEQQHNHICLLHRMNYSLKFLILNVRLISWASETTFLKIRKIQLLSDMLSNKTQMFET